MKQFDLVKDEYFHFIYQQYRLSTSKAVREAAQNALLASPPETLAASVTHDSSVIAAIDDLFGAVGDEGFLACRSSSMT